MKHQPISVDARIKSFMKKKMEEFPDLKQKYGPDVRVVQRGYLLDDVMSLFLRKVQG